MTRLRLAFTTIAMMPLVIVYGCRSDAVVEPAETGVPDATAPDAVPDAAADVAALGLDGGPLCPPIAAPSEASAPVPIPFATTCTYGFTVQETVHCLFDVSRDPKCAEGLVGDGGYAACSECLLKSGSDAGRGPIVVNDGIGELNVVDCLQTLSTDNDCAVRLARAEACTAAACHQCIARGIDVYGECRTAAGAGPCAAKLADAVGCVAIYTNPDGGPAAACNPAGTFIQGAIALGTLFCVGADAAVGD